MGDLVTSITKEAVSIAVNEVQGLLVKSQRLDRIEPTGNHGIHSFLRAMTVGLGTISTLMSQVGWKLSAAERQVKLSQSIAALELFPEYCTQKGIKGTAELMKFFIQGHETVLKAQEEASYWEHLHEYLKGVLSTVNEANTNARKLWCDMKMTPVMRGD